MIVAPPGFLEMEHTVVMHRPLPGVGAVLRAGATEAPPRPSLVITRRRAHDDVEKLARRMCDELARVVTGALTCDSFVFADRREGRLMSLTFDVQAGLTARQWIAIRCDHEWTSSATYTAPLAIANEEEAIAALRSLTGDYVGGAATGGAGGAAGGTGGAAGGTGGAGPSRPA